MVAFRRKVKTAHPDGGGTAEMFRPRDRLLTAIGTSAPAPKPPDYTPSGLRTIYHSGRSRRHRLGANTRRLTGRAASG